MHCNNYSGNKCCFRFDHTRHPRFPGVEVQEEEEKDGPKEPRCKEMNPLYGLYSFHDGEKMEDNYVSVTEENSYYGGFNPCEIVFITNKINTTQVNIF